MRLSHSSYQNYIQKLRDEIIDEKLYSPLLLNNKTIVFPFMEKSKEVLIIDLNPKMPILFKGSNDLFFSSFENSFLLRYRKHFGKTQIKDIELSNNDLIIKLKMFSLDNFVDFDLIVELIPSQPNLIILDENKNIFDAYFSNKNRNLQKGQKFIELDNEKLIDGEIQINDELLQTKINEEYEIRIKEKYSTFNKYLDSKIKGAIRKQKAIENDIKIASKTLIYQEIADDIFASGLDLKSHQNSYNFKNENIELDSAKTLLENAQQFYKKVRKAKETIKRAELNIETAKKEEEEFLEIKEEFDKANEHKKDELVSTYSNTKKKKEIKPTIVNRPWKVNLNGTIIYFGRNASQNDFLSFVMKIDREFTWLHIKDKSGAHLVIANKKPTENELLSAAEIALLCSRATTGEVTYTKKKNVRRGHVLGEALIKNYSNIKLNNIRKETISLFESAVRCN